MVANWDSDAGYAWWLMESFWSALSHRFQDTYHPMLAYPSISRVPEVIQESPITVVERDFYSFSPAKVMGLMGFLRKHRVRVLYLSDKPMMHWAYLAFRLAGVRRIVVHDHTPGLRTPPTGLKRALKALVARLPWVTPDALIGATEFIRRRFIEIAMVPEAKCFAAPNGIPLTLPPADDLHDVLSIPRERRVIITAARANHYKGAVFALEAFAELAAHDRSGDWHYVFCGDGPHLEEFREAAASMGLADRTSFPGRVDKVTRLFPSCYAAIHPSRGEVGYSLSILEYMLAGLPVVVPDNPSVDEATTDGETGLVYVEGDVSAAAAALGRLLADAAATRRMGEAAAADVRARYDLAGTHRALISVMEQVLER